MHVFCGVYRGFTSITIRFIRSHCHIMPQPPETFDRAAAAGLYSSLRLLWLREAHSPRRSEDIVNQICYQTAKETNSHRDAPLRRTVESAKIVVCQANPIPLPPAWY